MKKIFIGMASIVNSMYFLYIFKRNNTNSSQTLSGRGGGNTAQVITWDQHYPGTKSRKEWKEKASNGNYRPISFLDTDATILTKLTLVTCKKG